MLKSNLIANVIIDKAREIYGDDFIPLHRPVFNGTEKKYLNDCIDSNFVSSVGENVQNFENQIQEFTGSKYAIATVNGTAALHIALKLSGVENDSEVITQSLTFIATCNAIAYCNATPVFIDVDKETLGMSPERLEHFLKKNTIRKNNKLINKITKKRISACLPMHTFGNPCRIDDLKKICRQWGIPLVEDAAESLGSFFKDRHTGTFGQFGTFSFNGNKIITTGGGGMIVTNNKLLAQKAKHITTTSKKPHEYEFFHDEIGYNYRLPNLNATLGCSQMEQLPEFLKIKRKLFSFWKEALEDADASFFIPTKESESNYWLNAIICSSKKERNQILKITNQNGVMTRPIWKLMSSLPMFSKCQNDGLDNSLWLEQRVVNIPSSVYYKP